MNTTALIIQGAGFLVILFAQISLTAFTIGKMRGLINGLNNRVGNVEHGNVRAHKRLDTHIMKFHTSKGGR